MNHSIGVIIPTFNRKNYLMDVLRDLENQNNTGFTLTIIVVNDGSTDGTDEMLQEHGKCIVVKGNGNWWYTKCIIEGINVLLENNTHFILTLNDDVQLGSDYIDNLLKNRIEISEPCLIGSASYTLSTPHRISFSGIHSIRKWNLKEITNIPKFSVCEPTSKTGVLPSCNLSGRGMFFDTSIIRKIGNFDEKLIQYGSDTDFSYRAFKENIPVFVSFDAPIFENEKLTSKGTLINKPSFREFFKSWFSKYTVNSLEKTFYYYRKHGNRFLFPVYYSYVIVGMAANFFKSRLK